MIYPDPCAMFGISSDQYGIQPQDVEFLGQLITAHTEWRSIIELGTYNGLTALFMGLLIQDRGGQLISIDRADTRTSQVQNAWLPHMMHCSMDILSAPRNPGIESMILSAAPCLVVMDNGNKIQEVNNYAPIIPPGSAFCVHDYDIEERRGEVRLDDIRRTIEACQYVPEMHEEALALKSLFRCWVRS